jgi:6-phosphogluconolactonase
MASVTQHVLFAGGYAAADQPGIHAFDFDAVTGSLALRGSFTGIANPSFLVLHPNGPWLYAVSETGQADGGEHGAVWAFQVDRQSSAVQPINHQSTRGDWPCHLQIDATGRWIFASNYGTGDVAVFPILEDGGLGEMKAFVQHHGHGPNPTRQEGPHAHSTTLTPDNNYAIVADLGIDQLLIYAFNGETGALRQHALTRTRPGAGPRHLAFHQDGRRVYVANELDSTVAVYEYDVSNGSLQELQTLDTLPPGAPENIVADIHVSANGQRVYVSNRGHNSVAVYAVRGDGQLTRLAVNACGGKWPRNFTLAPDGRFMLVANEHSDEIAVLPLLDSTAELGEPVAWAAVGRPTCLQFAAA